MTMLFLDGGEAADFATKYDAFGTATITSTTTRYNSGSSITSNSVGGGTVVIRKNVTPSAKLVVGYAYKHAGSADASTLCAFYGDNGATLHVGFRLLSTGAIALVRGTTVVATSANGIFNMAGVWHYIEFSALLSDTVGTMEVKVNGVSAVTFSGDTKNAGTATTLDTIAWLYPGTTSAAPFYDDIYILNGLGSAPNNDFLGEIKVQTLVPDGAGSSTQLTPVGSGTNWQNVDELPIVGTDYNYSGTAGHKDLYTLTALAAGTASVFGVQANVVARKTDTGARSAKTAIKSGASSVSGAANAMGVANDTYSTIYETNPATSVAWTVADVAALEAGVEVV